MRLYVHVFLKWITSAVLVANVPSFVHWCKANWTVLLLQNMSTRKTKGSSWDACALLRFSVAIGLMTRLEKVVLLHPDEFISYMIKSVACHSSPKIAHLVVDFFTDAILDHPLKQRFTHSLSVSILGLYVHDDCDFRYKAILLCIFTYPLFSPFSEFSCYQIKGARRGLVMALDAAVSTFNSICRSISHM